MVKRLTIHVGWNVLVILVVASLILAGCSQPAAQPAAQPQADAAATAKAAAEASAVAAAAATLAPTATELASPTAVSPTATAQPTATATPLPPTATPVPPLAVLADGFSTWCAPLSYAGTQPKSPDAPKDAFLLTQKDKQFEVHIPAAYCVATVKFNQAAPKGATLVFYDGKTAFLKLPLAAADGQADTTWASFNHNYVVNPPLWEITYRMAVVSADGKELWTNSVKFAKTLPKQCPYGGLPDPVTLYCAKADPWEIETHPGIDTHYPYDHDNLPTMEP